MLCSGIIIDTYLKIFNMKKIAIFFLLATTTLLAQETITKKTGDFHTLKVYNGLRVQIEKGDVNSIAVSGKRSKDVIFKNANGVLKIRLDIPGVFNLQDVDVIHLIYAEEITVLDANEGASIVSEDIIKQDALETRVQEGATIDLHIEVAVLTAKAVTGGDLELNGIATNQNIQVATGGNYDAHELISENASVKATTGGEATVFTTKNLNAKATLSGEIYVYGNPKTVSKKTTLAGEIKLKN